MACTPSVWCPLDLHLGATRSGGVILLACTVKKFERKFFYRKELHWQSIPYERPVSSDGSLIHKRSNSLFGVWSLFNKRLVWRDRSLIEDRLSVHLLSIRDFSPNNFCSEIGLPREKSLLGEKKISATEICTPPPPTPRSVASISSLKFSQVLSLNASILVPYTSVWFWGPPYCYKDLI